MSPHFAVTYRVRLVGIHVSVCYGNPFPTSRSMTSWSSLKLAWWKYLHHGNQHRLQTRARSILFGWLCRLESVVIILWIAKRRKGGREGGKEIFAISKTIIQFSKGVTHVTSECIKFWHTSLLFHFHLIKINENINQHWYRNHTHSSAAIVGRLYIQEFSTSQQRGFVRINWPYGIYKQCLVNVMVYFVYVEDFMIRKLCAHILYISKIYNKHVFGYIYMYMYMCI